MNKIAKMADEFVGEEFTMACFNSTQLYFHFGLKKYICVNDEYQIIIYNTELERSKVPKIDNNICKFFDKKVLDLTQDDFGSINILFESGEILKIIKSASYVEWIEVKYGDVIDYGENF